MPNVCVTAFADGNIKTIEVEEWPDLDFIQEAVGGMFTEVPTSFRMEYDESWGDEAGVQETVVYCNEAGLLRGFKANATPIARAINRELGEELVGNILVVSGSPSFMALQD